MLCKLNRQIEGEQKKSIEEAVQQKKLHKGNLQESENACRFPGAKWSWAFENNCKWAQTINVYEIEFLDMLIRRPNSLI